MIKLDIAGVLIEINSDIEDKFGRFEEFSYSYHEKPHMKVSMSKSDAIQKPEGKLMLNEKIIWIQKLQDKKICIYVCTEERIDGILAKLEVGDNWIYNSIIYLKNNLFGKNVLKGIFGQIMFNNRILFFNGLVIHASAIECEGKGIMFSAPSETGKSTQANLWKIYKGAEVMNGDRPAVRVIEGQSYVYGTPWSGSSSDFINKRAPLSAIIILEQAEENSIYRLSNHEAILRLMPRCFLPYFDNELMNIAINNLEMIITTTIVYLLKCRPDREAVELVYQCVK